MSRHLRNSSSSSYLNPKEPRSDDSPAPSNARFSTRVRTLLEGVSPLKVPTVTPEPKIPKRKKSPGRKEKNLTPIGDPKVIRRLAKLKSLPPISPRGRRFADGVRDGTFAYADVAGEGLSRFLQDGLPKYEVFFGDTKANSIRYNIEVLYRADPTEMRDKIFSCCDEYEPVHKWSAEEKSKVSRYPMAIRTSGVALVKPIKQHVNARGKSEANSPMGSRKKNKDSPEVLWMREKMAAISSTSGGESPISLPPLDMSDYKDAMESSREGDHLLKNNPAPADQLDSKDWSSSSDGWTTSSSQSSDFDSDSDEEDWTSEDKVLREMFPHARYRQM